jgi:electron transfer flavoprotein alpha subunit
MTSSRQSFEPYTPDAFAHALKEFLAQHPAKLVLMPHTYQVRDFVPKLATALKTTAISDVIGYKYEGGKLLFTRQMFQGKFVADVSFHWLGHMLCDLPEWIVSRR